VKTNDAPIRGSYFRQQGEVEHNNDPRKSTTIIMMIC